MSSCKREYTIRDTLIETIRLITNTHINPLGVLHGGHALKWMVTTGSMAAMRVARGPALLAHMDNVFFLHPLRLGRNAVITAWIEYIGRSSMESTVMVEEEDPVTGERRLTTAAHMTYVAVDRHIRPRPVLACIRPDNTLEEELYQRAIERRKQRDRDREKPSLRPIVPGAELENHILVNPEDSIAYNAMHAGRLLHLLDETAGILAIKYAQGPAVTAAVDATDFTSPILVGNIVDVHAAITFVGRSSVEVGISVETTNPYTGNKIHAASSFFTMVHLSPETGRPAPVPKPPIREAWQEELVREAEERRQRRLERLEFFKREVARIKPPLK